MRQRAGQLTDAGVALPRQPEVVLRKLRVGCEEFAEELGVILRVRLVRVHVVIVPAVAVAHARRVGEVEDVADEVPGEGVAAQRLAVVEGVGDEGAELGEESAERVAPRATICPCGGRGLGLGWLVEEGWR